jgi:NAD+ kinase
MTSTTGSTQRSQRVNAVAIITHGSKDVSDAVAHVERAAAAADVTVVDDPRAAELAVAVGGDGTILRALTTLLGSGVPVIGVNYGRVGFLASIAPDRVDEGLARVFAGEYSLIELPTVQLLLDGGHHVAVNDVVATSSVLGRMVEVGWAVGGEDLGVVPCDGMIASTPSGSTAYNLSNGGPVLVRGLDAMAITFIAPHSLHARPLVVPRGLTLTIANRTADVPVAVLTDGHRVGEIAPGGEAAVWLCEQRSLLATLPETTFFGRYRQTFVA